MTMRDEFEKWAELHIGWNDLELKRDNDDPDSYLMDITQYAWSAWQAARAQGGQGAEPIGYIEQDEFDALKDGCFGASIRAEDDKPDCIPLYTQPQPAVPECPYPCGWDALFKIIVQNAASFARSTLDDEVPESVRQMGIDSGQYAIHLCKLAMKLSTPTTPQADGWVKCSEQLPKVNQKVRLNRNGEVLPYEPSFRFNAGEAFWDFDDYDADPDILPGDRWMPTGLKRPQPPAEQGGKGDE